MTRPNRLRPLIVGEAPNRTGDPATPIDGAIGHRLAASAGLSLTMFRRTFAFANVLASYPGSAGKGAAFDVDEARRRAVAMGRRFVRGRVVVLLGKRVARAFGVRPTYLVEQDVLGARVFVAPHPSGINRWFNDPANGEAFGRFMRGIAKTGDDRD